MTFKDHFSTKAAAYARYRPTYPRALIELVVGLAPQRQLAWDCATGAGQAARALAEHFARVVATDASAQQIAHATPHPRIEYRVALAEQSGLPDASFDLVTVAQALHWFDLQRFYAEVARVLVPGGALAVWSYGDPFMEARALDATLQYFNHVTVGPFWPSDRHSVGEGYRALPFPFDEVRVPPMELAQDWTLEQVAGYARTWSATTRYAAERGTDPIPGFVEKLARDFGDPETCRRITWPLTVRAGRKPAAR